MKIVTFIYAGLLIFFSMETLVLILAGLHGRIMVDDPITLEYLIIILAFLTTSIVCILNRNALTTRWKCFFVIILNAATLVLLYNQTMEWYPVVYTGMSTFILALHFLGMLLGIIIVFRIIVSFFLPPHA